MSLLVFILIVLIVVGVVIAVCNYIPFPAPLSWLRWAIPAVALVFALIVILQKAGMLA
jgi:hypothetical protein